MKKEQNIAKLSNEKLSIESVIQKINSFASLEENWDSYGVLKPSATAIKNAKRFIKRTDSDGLAVYFTAPGRNGDVTVEYKLSDTISAELYFNGNGTNDLLIFDVDECIIEGTIEDSYNKLLKYINE